MRSFYYRLAILWQVEHVCFNSGYFTPFSPATIQLQRTPHGSLWRQSPGLDVTSRSNPLRSWSRSSDRDSRARCRDLNKSHPTHPPHSGSGVHQNGEIMDVSRVYEGDNGYRYLAEHRRTHRSRLST